MSSTGSWCWTELDQHKVTRIGPQLQARSRRSRADGGTFYVRAAESQPALYQGGPIRAVYFAGACPGRTAIFEKEHKGFVKVFQGGESVRESLAKFGIPAERIPKTILESSSYDDFRMEFAERL